MSPQTSYLRKLDPDMSAKIDFPTEQDFTADDDDFTDRVRNLRSVLSKLNEVNPSQYKPRDWTFIEKTLPAIWRSVKDAQSVSRSLVKEIQGLSEQLCLLAKKLGLNQKLVQAIASSFDDSMKVPVIYTLVDLSDEQRAECANIETVRKDMLRTGKPAPKQMIMTLIQQILTTGLLQKAKEMVDNEREKIPISTLATICQLFWYIESSLSQVLVSYFLPSFVQGAVNGLRDHGSDYNQLCQFLSTFAKMVPSKLDDILNLFCELSVQGNSVQTRFLVVSHIVQIVKACGIGASGERVKRALIGAVSTPTHQSVMKQVFQFLPSLAEMTPFSDQDLCDIMFKSQSGEEQRVRAICEIVSNIPRHLDDFAQEVAQSNVFHPALYCALIGNVESEDLSRLLFEKLLESHERLKKYNMSSISINRRLRMHIEELMNGSDNMELLASLSFFFLNAPHLDSLHGFVERVIDLSVKHHELLDMLSGFSRILNSFHSEDTIMCLFDAVFEQLKTSKGGKYQEKILEVLSEWITSCDKIPSAQMFEKLRDIDFSRCPSELPPLIQKIIMKCDKIGNIGQFLLKILKDTVPPKHAAWLIDTIFREMHSEKAIQEMVQILVDALESESTFVNAAYLIVEAVKYEADFYRLGECFGYVQKLNIIYEGSEIDGMIGLHPFHSTRRLYAYISDHLQLHISGIKLVTNNGSEDKVIANMMPLETIPLDSKGVLTVTVETDDGGNFLTNVRPLFMETLVRKSRLSDLFNHLPDDGNIESELFFLIMSLFKPMAVKPTTNLQMLSVGKCDDPFVYQDSIRLFPFAIRAVQESGGSLDSDQTERMLNVINSHFYDRVSMALMCYSIPKMTGKHCFSANVLQQCLLETDSPLLRDAFLNLVSDETNRDLLVPLLALSCEKPYRFKSRQFFECVKRFNFQPEIFVPFYRDLKQAEGSHYSDIDETFIALISLIPVTEELVQLTLDRLFSPPTCMNMTVPFVHTVESWTAALKYLETEIAIPKIEAWLETLRGLPSTNMKLSNDFTYVGRNGINNLGSTCYVNSLLQVLNGLDCVSLKLIEQETAVLSPFVQQLRDLLAQLRYTRGQVLSIQRLVETIPNFKVSIQEDAEEFLNMLVNRLNDELDNSSYITDHMRGELTTFIRTDSRVLSSRSQDFFYLSLPTKGCSRLDDAFAAYFEDDPMTDGYLVEGESNRVAASSRVAITRWPDYLVIQLQRWDFAMETGERNKLVHELDFPIELKTQDIRNVSDSVECDFDYTLAGVVVHQGTADQGHYMTVVKGDDEEWYLCNDQTIEYFDVDQLDNWAFGISDETSGISEEVITGYLLFYKRTDLVTVKTKIPEDLEAELNKQNEIAWSSTIFYSPLFVQYAKNLMLSNLDNEAAVKLGLTVFFKISIIDDGSKQNEEEESLLVQWHNILQRKVLTTKERCMVFFEYLDQSVGDSLGTIIGLTDNVTTVMSNLITHAFGKLRDTTKPLKILLGLLNNANYKRQVLAMTFDLIADACHDLKVNWCDEEDVLLMMLNYLSIPISKEVLRPVAKAHFNAFNMLMEVLNDIIKVKGCTETILQTFDIEKLNIFCNMGKKSENFTKLLQIVNTLRPDLFQDLSNANQAVKMMLAQTIPSTGTQEPEEQIELDLDFLWPNISKMLFSDKTSLRVGCHTIIAKIIGRPDNLMAAYLKGAILDESLTRPRLTEENSVSIFISSLVPAMVERIQNGNEECCNEFIDLLHKLSFASPRILTVQFKAIVQVFVAVREPTIATKLLEVIHNLIAFDGQLKELVTESEIQAIMGSRLASPDIVQLMVAFRDYASGSPLAGACVEYYFTEDEDDGSRLLIKLLEEGLVPGDFPIPERSSDLSKLKFANALWNLWTEKRDQLSDYMLSALKRAHPLPLFLQSPTVKATCDILSGYCKDRLDSVMNLSKEQESVEM